jgi:hypothetical protein
MTSSGEALLSDASVTNICQRTQSPIYQQASNWWLSQILIVVHDLDVGDVMKYRKRRTAAMPCCWFLCVGQSFIFGDPSCFKLINFPQYMYYINVVVSGSTSTSAKSPSDTSIVYTKERVTWMNNRAWKKVASVGMGGQGNFYTKYLVWGPTEIHKDAASTCPPKPIWRCGSSAQSGDVPWECDAASTVWCHTSF